MIFKSVVFLWFLFFIYGCSYVAKNYEADPILEQQTDLLNTETNMIDVGKLKTRIGAISNSTNNKKEKDRNRLIFEIVSISDRVCSLHQAHIISNVNTWNVATGTLTNVFSALGTVLGGVTTKASLAAAATVSGSTRSLVNQEVYVEAMGTTIVRAISIAREREYAKIVKKSRGSIDDYSLSESLRDIQEYHRRCSFYYGVLEVSKALDQRKKTKAEIDNDIAGLQEQLEELRNNGIDETGVKARIETLLMERPDATE